MEEDLYRWKKSLWAEIRDEKEEEKLQNFLILLEDVPGEHKQDKALLIRWMRGFPKLEDSAKFYREAIAWRAETKPHLVRLNKSFFQELLDAGAVYWFGRDKEGHPTQVIRLGRLKPELLDLDKVVALITYITERGIRIMRRVGVDRYVALVDRQGVSKKQLNLELIKKVSTLQEKYPDMMERLFICDPNTLIKLLWKSCKPFITKQTRNKFIMLDGKNWRDTILEYWDPDQLEADFGGTSTWKFSGSKTLDYNSEDEDELPTMEEVFHHPE